uniref:Uncharacterized protein n=1 Tax=Nephroselmis olivacea TaxID=31312 RepID=Q9T3X5_NEPOL|nr:hypothetical protein NeolCp101 [Nephroselmis olivacea]NP_050941.1 hypothetical protein NeolCp136 [Nephroselmis olivacea]AAD54877.1 unknown [Nephroselmis olivacea]AAD54912.1 unknown [Nephroselmis olivacea]
MKYLTGLKSMGNSGFFEKLCTLINLFAVQSRELDSLSANDLTQFDLMELNPKPKQILPAAEFFIPRDPRSHHRLRD